MAAVDTARFKEQKAVQAVLTTPFCVDSLTMPPIQASGWSPTRSRWTGQEPLSRTNGRFRRRRLTPAPRKMNLTGARSWLGSALRQTEMDAHLHVRGRELFTLHPCSRDGGHHRIQHYSRILQVRHCGHLAPFISFFTETLFRFTVEDIPLTLATNTCSKRK